MTVIHSLAIVLEYRSSTKTWESRRLDLLGQNVTLPEVCFIFLESSEWYQKHCSEDDRKKILVQFHTPGILTNDTCTYLNGYCGSQSSFSEDGDKNKLDSFSASSIVLHH
ncbi:uncharacterized protein ALTATR162_LOCUS4991 [Alternaria atra]|uniref:Uncharacterized protein n=1 Tax=Alternaria atra TaxID=119953 RepID=A0A8J2I995_9PLEO|nr:uncharacterized protein ALTATR162_LOCUS4991 [Alternaria atra]CAG5158116.1 unnamed protein product [Alternaria atra]